MRKFHPYHRLLVMNQETSDGKEREDSSRKPIWRDRNKSATGPRTTFQIAARATRMAVRDGVTSHFVPLFNIGKDPRGATPDPRLADAGGVLCRERQAR